VAGFPNATTSSNGSVTVKYVTGSISASGIAVANITAVFSPAVRLYDGPVPNGTQWSTTSQVTFTGAVAEEVRYAAHAPGGETARWEASTAATVAATDPITVTCVSTTVLVPGGPNGSEVQCGSTGNVSVGADGLALIPTSVLNGNATSGSAPSNGADPPAAESAVPARPIYRPGSTAPESVTASPQSGQSLTAAPMSANDARAQMSALRTPSPPASQPGGSPAPVLLLIGGVAVLVVAVAVARKRRRVA
jgi:hypothetical protein